VAFAEAVEHARSRRGPALLEATCYRFRGHYEGDFDLYRPKHEKEAALRERDPLILTARRLIEGGNTTQSELDSIVKDARAELSVLLAHVRADKAPDPREALRYVFSS
jgi:TPP-dependent pyruvate/acetoin dehydrogenase alpha subunit